MKHRSFVPSTTSWVYFSFSDDRVRAGVKEQVWLWWTFWYQFLIWGCHPNAVLGNPNRICLNNGFIKACDVYAAFLILSKLPEAVSSLSVWRWFVFILQIRSNELPTLPYYYASSFLSAGPELSDSRGQQTWWTTKNIDNQLDRRRISFHFSSHPAASQPLASK